MATYLRYLKFPFRCSIIKYTASLLNFGKVVSAYPHSKSTTAPKSNVATNRITRNGILSWKPTDDMNLTTEKAFGVSKRYAEDRTGCGSNDRGSYRTTQLMITKGFLRSENTDAMNMT